MHPSLTASPSDPDGTLYVTPTGRLCRRLPLPRSGPGSDASRINFEYVDGHGEAIGKAPEQLTLSRTNVGLLRRVRNER